MSTRLLIVVAALAIAGCLHADIELVVNGGFETDLAGFSGHVNADIDRREPRSGDYCVRLQGTSDRNNYVQQDVRVEGGRTYRYTVWARSQDVPAGADAKAYYNVFAGDKLLGSFAPFRRVSGTGGWRRYSTEVTMPDSADRCCLILQLYKSAGVVWYDDVSFVRLLTAQERAAQDARHDSQQASAQRASLRLEQAESIAEGIRFLKDEEMGELFLSCGRTAYTFGPGEQGFPLRSLVDLQTGTEFIVPGGDSGLLRLELRPSVPYAYATTVVEPGPATYRLEPGEETARLVIEYGPRQGVNCTVTVTAGADGLTRWGLEVQAPKGLGVWLADFPRIDRLGAQGDEQAEYLAVPSRQGQLQRNPRADIAYSEGWSDYPGGGKTMQFEAYCAASRQCGLYVATEDPGMLRKSTSYVGKGDWMQHFVRHYPEDMGRCSEYRQPYPVVLGTFGGDWYDACVLYRKWALGQPWSAAGTVATRGDIPDWMRGLGAWCQGDMPGVSREDMEPQVRSVSRFAQTVGAPVAFHAYIWQTSGKHDAGYPVFEPKPGFAQAVRDMQAQGVHVVPYINVYSADAAGPAWTDMDLLPLRLKPPIARAYSDMKHLVPMCPAAERWQQIIRDQCHKLMQDLPIDGLYLDQLTGAPFMCFEPDHGHPLGGGAHFAEGMRRIALDAAQAVRDSGTEGITFGENCNEIYNDAVAAHLTWHEMQPGDIIPMFPTVYADRVIRLGCFIGRPDTWSDATGYYSKLGLSFTWGEQLGWIMFGVLSNFEEPALAPLRKYLSDLAKTRVASLDFLCYGRMLRAPVLDVPELPIAWNDWSATRRGMLPAVLTSAWQAPDGRIGLALCNWTAEPRQVSIPRSTEWALEGALSYRVCSGGQWSQPRGLDGASLSVPVSAHSGLLVALSPADTPAAAD